MVMFKRDYKRSNTIYISFRWVSLYYLICLWLICGCNQKPCKSSTGPFWILYHTFIAYTCSTPEYLPIHVYMNKNIFLNIVYLLFHYTKL